MQFKFRSENSIQSTNNIKNTTNKEEEDSLCSAYETKLQNLYNDSLEITKKINMIDKAKNKLNRNSIKSYQCVLSKTVDEILRTVHNKLFEQKPF